MALAFVSYIVKDNWSLTFTRGIDNCDTHGHILTCSIGVLRSLWQTNNGTYTTKSENSFMCESNFLHNVMNDIVDMNPTQMA